MAQDAKYRPLTAEELRKLPVERASSAVPPDARVLLGSYIIETTTARPPDVSSRVTALEKGSDSGVARYRVDLELQGAVLPLKTSLPMARQKWPAPNVRGLRRPVSTAHRPPFHDLRMVPERRSEPELPTELRQLEAVRELPLGTVREPNPRFPFSDTSFPWCTFGRVTTERMPTHSWAATGVMVGPRHLLTNNRAVPWHGQQAAGWVSFAPSYFHGATPFGSADVIKHLWWRSSWIRSFRRSEHLACV